MSANNSCGPRFNGREFEFLRYTEEGVGYGTLSGSTSQHKEKQTTDAEVRNSGRES